MGTKKTFLTVWDDILKESTEVEFKAGQVVFYQGHSPFGVFIITSGKVSIAKGKSKEDESEQCLIHMSPVGLDWILENQDYPFTATAEDEVKGCFVNRSVLNKILDV